MLFDVIKTDEREEKYLFAEYQTGSTPNSIYVRSDDNRFVYGNTDQLKGKVFGVEKDSYITTLFTEWCETYGFEPQVVEYADISCMNAALDAGEIDAGVYGGKTMDGYATIAEFSPTPYYSIFRLDEIDLKSKVDSAMSSILSDDALYGDRLLEKYASSSSSVMSALSSSEAAFVAEHPTVTVAALENDAPYYWIDSHGKARGALVDYCAKLGQLTGLSFSIKAYSSQSDAVSAVKSGEADMIGIYSNGLVAAYRSGLELTSTYASEDVVEVTHAGTNPEDIKRIAVKERSKKGFEDTLGLKGVEYVGYETAHDCFDALSSGEVDAMISGSPSATYLINQTNSSAYTIQSIPTLKMEMCGALGPRSDDLCSILNKAIAVSTSDFDAYLSTNTMTEDSVKTMVSRLSPAIIVGVGAGLSALVVGLAASLAMLAKRQREAASVAAAKADNARRKTEILAAQRANEERNDFFSAISHDMRTPLNAIIGFSTLAKEKEQNPEVDDYLNKIQLSGNVLLGLIDDTLTISKVSSGKLRLNLAPVDSAILFNSVVVTIGEFAKQHQVSFEFVDESMRRTIMADELNVEKIFLNLLSNAVKYTPAGGHVRLIVKNEEGAHETPDSVLIVEDDGIGMSAEFLPHIYEPFVQENGQSGSSSGNGLGLSIVKQLVDLMGGTIDVESEKGKGTRFTVRLHFEEADPALAERGIVSNASDPKGDPSVNLKGRRVLLCEDNRLNAEIAQAFLSQEGVEVDLASNGEEGVATFAKSEPGAYAAILMDVRMPVMDGLEATRAIRALDRDDAATIPVIAMTADAFEDDIKKCLDAGMNAHIAKPLDPAKVHSTLVAEVGRSHRGIDSAKH